MSEGTPDPTRPRLFNRRAAIGTLAGAGAGALVYAWSAVPETLRFESEWVEPGTRTRLVTTAPIKGEAILRVELVSDEYIVEVHAAAVAPGPEGTGWSIDLGYPADGVCYGEHEYRARLESTSGRALATSNPARFYVQRFYFGC